MPSKVIGSSSLLEDGKKDTEIVQDKEEKKISYLVYITTVKMSLMKFILKS